ncbi:LysR substrate-binding domain-containing protein [Grimontia sp. NTOU-MAR1]|uniref:LysR substrate-binding domain-containing protein n=1 Tax=Grimontia sp. NTOU-MAR1 TaxID=3111011 RepID=UPI002DB930A7|nr:LysR substrate-binding domain-containing protein [Grimontia sp. NTOU-MAR1]WRW00635.1 LysR substrate-binding domain-containing protein [Grimontia sp. NTOU-MAR1]
MIKPRRLTPSLNALRAFEASARYESFVKAAEELAVTPGAISQQVSALEEKLGLALFDRVKQRLYLTQAGKTYLSPLRESFDRMESATQDLLTYGGTGGKIKLGVLPTIATYWLIPKLPAFSAQFPNIELQMETLELNFVSPERAPNLEGGLIDVGIFYGDGYWKNLHAEKLLEENIIAVATPESIDNCKGNNPFHILPLLRHSTRPQTWELWSDFIQDFSLAPKGPSFEHFYMLKAAVLSSMGIALLPDIFVQQEIQSGALIQLNKSAMKSNHAYYIVYQEKGREDMNIDVFCKWLLGAVDLW